MLADLDNMRRQVEKEQKDLPNEQKAIQTVQSNLNAMDQDMVAGLQKTNELLGDKDKLSTNLEQGKEHSDNAEKLSEEISEEEVAENTISGVADTAISQESSMNQGSMSKEQQKQVAKSKKKAVADLKSRTDSKSKELDKLDIKIDDLDSKAKLDVGGKISFWERVKAFFSSTFTSIRVFFRSLVSKLSSAFGKAKERIKSMIQKIKMKFVKYLLEASGMDQPMQEMMQDLSQAKSVAPTAKQVSNQGIEGVSHASNQTKQLLSEIDQAKKSIKG